MLGWPEAGRKKVEPKVINIASQRDKRLMRQLLKIHEIYKII
jgi:hypothetical protein